MPLKVRSEVLRTYMNIFHFISSSINNANEVNRVSYVRRLVLIVDGNGDDYADASVYFLVPAKICIDLCDFARFVIAR